MARGGVTWDFHRRDERCTLTWRRPTIAPSPCRVIGSGRCCDWCRFRASNAQWFFFAIQPLSTVVLFLSSRTARTVVNEELMLFTIHSLWRVL